MRRWALGAMLMLLIAGALSPLALRVPLEHACAQVPPSVEFICGVDLVGTNVTDPVNVTLENGTNVPYGYRCEILYYGNDTFIDSFFMGTGTWPEKDGQFHHVSALGGQDPQYPIEVYVRAYNGTEVHSSESYGDSEVLMIDGPTDVIYIQGWSLGTPLRPFITIDNPQEGTLAGGWGGVQVNGTVGPPQIISEIAVSTNGVDWDITGGDDHWSYWYSGGEGEVHIWVRATSYLGYEAFAEVNFTVDATPPEITITSPDLWESVSVSEITAQGTAFDENGIEYVEIQVNYQGWQTCSGTEYWSHDIWLNEGDNPIEIRARDMAGNENYAYANIFREWSDGPGDGDGGSGDGDGGEGGEDDGLPFGDMGDVGEEICGGFLIGFFLLLIVIVALLMVAGVVKLGSGWAIFGIRKVQDRKHS